ncbi:MAG: putative transcriptional regulator [Alphaproteobacteria bacterium]|jgi:putative transcriptional regulator
MELTNGYLEGRFLIATPGIHDARFDQAVIYIFKHDYSGASGIVINQVSNHINFLELCNQLSIPATGDLSRHVLYDGGPVESNRGYVLHSDDFKGRDTQVFENTGLALTTTIDVIRKLAEGSQAPKQSLISLGYVGWAPGQLESELQKHGWLYCNADKNIIFDTPYMMRWQTAVNKIGFQINQITDYSGHA